MHTNQVQSRCITSIKVNSLRLNWLLCVLLYGIVFVSLLQAEKQISCNHYLNQFLEMRFQFINCFCEKLVGCLVVDKQKITWTSLTNLVLTSKIYVILIFKKFFISFCTKLLTKSYRKIVKLNRHISLKYSASMALQFYV